MASIQEQIKLEEAMVGHGVAKYLAAMNEKEEGGRGRDTSYARRMTKEMMGTVSEYINTKITLARQRPGVKAKFFHLLKDTDTLTVAYIALCGLFDQLLSRNRDSELSMTTLARVIGDRIHDEIRFSAFQKEHGDYYDSIIDDFKRKGTLDYRHMHRVLTNKANEKQVGWEPWTEHEQIHVGHLCIEAIKEVTDLVDIAYVRVSRKTKIYVRASDTLMNWITEHKEFMSMLAPETGPLIIQPLLWTAYNEGGFYTPALQRRNRMIKLRSKDARAYVEGADLTKVKAGLNAIQCVKWQVNSAVLENMRGVWDSNSGIGMPSSQPLVIPPCPLPEGLKKDDATEEQRAEFEEWNADARDTHNAEHKRRSKCLQLSRVIDMATKYSEYSEIYFTNTTDFRGRVYATSSSFHPQGADFSKGLLRFKRSKELGRDGLYWFKVHGANKFGEDSGTYDSRVAWVDKHHHDIIRASEEPLMNGEFWGVDKAYQFLAWCHEYREAMAGNPETFRSHLPVALDGSCNGLQNFSAMLRDSIGGQATNLIPGTSPADIYAAVCTVLISKLEYKKDEELAQQWLTYGLDRSISKKPVMTLPYGSTRRSCTDSILRHIKENAPLHFGESKWKAAQYITPLLWDSIGEVVVAAREAMAWLQKCSRILSKENLPIYWKTSLGFPVYQDKKKMENTRVETQLMGRLFYTVSNPTDQICSRQQASGISPNFVHSQDATHMLRVATAAVAEDMDVAMIHDDFGTHACDIPRFNEIIRNEFVDMYSKDVLGDFKKQVEESSGLELPELPPTGVLDVQQIRKSPYFFG